MANWNKIIMTDVGATLQAKINAGLTTLKFTRVAIGSGTRTGSLNSATALINEQMTLGINKITQIGNTVTLELAISNSGVKTGFKISELGLFATDPDVGEIMYVAMTDDNPDYMPAEGGSTVVQQEFQLQFTMSNTGNVSAVLDSKHLVTQADLQAHDENPDAHVALVAAIKDAIKQAIIPLEYPSAASHNAFYRGKNLTEYFNSGEMSKAIAAGTFDDIYPGDYIIKTVVVDGTTYENTKWIVGDLDYHLGRGDQKTARHHVLVFPEKNLGTSYMNPTITTEGGYLGSYMWKNRMPVYSAAIKNAFGASHVLEHRERLTAMVDTNAYSGAGGMGNGAAEYVEGKEWTSVTANIFNEAMMYGHAPFASSGRDTYDCNKQIAAFRYGQNFVPDMWCWLRDVASSVYFAAAGGYGEADCHAAADVAGVRPYFLLT